MNKTVCSKEHFFKAFADETRLRLIHLMSAGEICVCYLVEVLGQPQSKISRHLAYLRQAGIVAARRDGKWMHYRLEPQESPGTARVMRQMLTWLGEDKKMKADAARLNRTCCIPEKKSALQGAPFPVLRTQSARKRIGKK